jgi:hypothetical protein
MFIKNSDQLISPFKEKRPSQNDWPCGDVCEWRRSRGHRGSHELLSASDCQRGLSVLGRAILSTLPQSTIPDSINWIYPGFGQTTFYVTSTIPTPNLRQMDARYKSLDPCRYGAIARWLLRQ